MEPDLPRPAGGEDAARGPLDPADARAIIEAQRVRVRDTADVDGRVIFLAWTIAWLLGYGLLWFSSTRSDGGRPAVWAYSVFALLVVGGVVTTVVHSISRMSGMAGPSRAVGQMYGWSWFVAFLAGQGMVGALSGFGLSDEGVALAANGMSALIVGILYMAGGMLWRVRSLFAIGVWMAIVAAVATSAGLPGSFAIMALAGSGGFAVGAVFEQLSRRSARGPAEAVRA